MQVFINPTDSAANIAAIADQLTKAVKSHADKQFKAFMVFVSAKAGDVQKLADEKKIDNVGMMLLSGPDDPAVQEYKINTDKAVKNTVIIYRRKTVTATLVNYDAQKDADKLEAAINKAIAG